MTRAVLSIGSNLGDRAFYLRMAVTGLAPAVRAVSSAYETAPWGVTDQPSFLNAVLIVEDASASPRTWLERAWQLEATAQRRRERRWGPRSLDVDVITVDGATSAGEQLTLPHPRAAERAFVLVPWLEVEPEAELAGHGRVADLLAALPESERAGVWRCQGVVLA